MAVIIAVKIESNYNPVKQALYKPDAIGNKIFGFSKRYFTYTWLMWP